MLNLKIVNRFWSKVKGGNPNECWEWQRGKTHDGYGVFGLHRKNMRAHRVAWKIINGKIPTNLHVLHRCDNPGCVNPAHLFLGTNDDNIADRQAKKRQAKGTGINCVRLTENDVLKIRVMLANGISERKVANIFGVSRGAIQGIKYNITWRHVK